MVLGDLLFNETRLWESLLSQILVYNQKKIMWKFSNDNLQHKIFMVISNHSNNECFFAGPQESVITEFYCTYFWLTTVT